MKIEMRKFDIKGNLKQRSAKEKFDAEEAEDKKKLNEELAKGVDWDDCTPPLIKKSHVEKKSQKVNSQDPKKNTDEHDRHPDKGNHDLVSYKVGNTQRLDDLQEFISFLIKVPSEKKIDVFKLPVSKQMLLNELNKRYGQKNWGIKIDAFNDSVWKTKRRPSICNNVNSGKRIEEGFFKNMLG